MEIAFEDGKLIYKGEAAAKLFTLDPDKHGWERFGQDHNGLLGQRAADQALCRGRLGHQARRQILSAVRSARDRVQRLRQRHLCVGQAARAVQICRLQPDRLQAGRVRRGRRATARRFEDAHGNWWNTGTPWIGYNWTFERRINMFPTKFEADGQMSVLVALRGLPAIHADARRSTISTACSPAGCCCRTARRSSASSTLGEFAADRVTDENPRTFWVAAANSPARR